MSQPTIKFHSATAPLSRVDRSAVIIPASGPWPSQRSLTAVTPSAAYLRGGAITVTCSDTAPSSTLMRKSMGIPSISTNALSRPKRVLPPPANRYACAILGSVLSPPTLFFLDRLSSRPPNSQFAQFLLQTLPMQTNGRRSPRNIQAMIGKLLSQIRDLKFPLGLAKILLAQSIVTSVPGSLAHQHLAVSDLL